MKSNASKILIFLLIFTLVCATLLSIPMAFASSVITTTATGYTNASDVEYVTQSGYVANWGARGETATFLSSYAEDFYTGSYTYETLSSYSGGTTQSNASSSALYAQLKSFMTTNHTHKTSYDETRYLYKYTDCVSNNYSNISSFYSGTTLSGTWDSGATWNREHTWPNSKGLGGSDEDDIMMLRPTSVSENSSRGNTAYGESSGYYDPNSENPPASLRGDCARIVLYVYTRWGNTSYMWGSSGVMQSIDVLLKWMAEDPVDTWELGRNDAVQAITGTRNVFVDYPELAWQLFGQQMPSGTVTPSSSSGEDSSTPVTEIVLDTNSITLAVGQTQQISASVNPSEASQKVEFSSNNTSVATVDSDGVVTAKGSGSATITVKSAVSEIRNYVTVTVKQAMAIAVSGTPNTTSYFAGQKFDASGLTVSVTYDDNSTGVLQSTDCQWLDANTQAETLSQGTTSVICKYGDLTATVSGITVGEAQSQTVTITRDNVANQDGSYKWHSWQSGEVTGEAFTCFPASNQRLQFNSSKTHYYLYGQTPTPIQSITVYLESGGAQWELLTSSTPFDNSSTPYPSSGTNHGTKTVTTSGVTWTLDGQHKYFSLNYKGSGVTYIQKIEITYGGSSGGEVTPPENNDSVTLDKTAHSMQTTDTFTLSATASGDVVWSSSNTNVATVSDGVVTAIGKGTATITATCGTAKATCVVTVTQKPCQTHTFGDWIVSQQPTCQAEGSRYKECSVCGEKSAVETIAKTDHAESDWIVDKQPTCKEEGSHHKECTVCGQITTSAQTIAKTENHTFGIWQTTVYPTPTANGTQTRECQVCGQTESRQIEYAGEVDDFVQAVSALQNATTLDQQYQLICNAVNIYNGYTAQQKQLVASHFATLKGYVENYNQQVSQVNQTSQDTLKVVVSSLCLTSLALALWYVLKKRV